MYEDWTVEEIKKHIVRLDLFELKMEKEFFEEKLEEKSKPSFIENDYVDLKVDMNSCIHAYKADYLGVEEGMLKGGIGGMILTGLIILITTVLFLMKVADRNTFLEIIFISGLGFIIALTFFIMGLFQHRYLKKLFKDCHFTYFKVADFKKKGFSKYKTITVSFKDYRGYEETKKIRGQIANEYAKHGSNYYDSPNMKRKTIIAYNYQGKFALIYNYTLKNPNN